MSLFLDLVFPSFCLQCKKPGLYFCQKCIKKEAINSLKTSSNNLPLEGSLSLFRYNSLIRQLITQIKYGFVTDITTPFVNYSAKTLKNNFPHLIEYWQKNNFVLVPIPLHYYRLNWRGFNQSFLLGKLLAKKLNLKFSPNFLKRSKNTHIQAKIKKKGDKKKNLENAFFLSNDKIPQNIILFDDISTTFSTLNSALYSLSKNGDLNRCWFLTLAG